LVVRSHQPPSFLITISPPSTAQAPGSPAVVHPSRLLPSKRSANPAARSCGLSALVSCAPAESAPPATTAAQTAATNDHPARMVPLPNALPQRSAYPISDR